MQSFESLTRFDKLGNMVTITRTDRITGVQKSRDFPPLTDILILLNLAYIYGAIDVSETLGKTLNKSVNECHVLIEDAVKEVFGECAT